MKDRPPASPLNLILIECNWKIGLKRSTVNTIHVVRCTLVYSSVHLCGRINFNFWFDLIIAYSPFVHLHVIDIPMPNDIRWVSLNEKIKSELFSIYFNALLSHTKNENKKNGQIILGAWECDDKFSKLKGATVYEEVIFFCVCVCV